MTARISLTLASASGSLSPLACSCREKASSCASTLRLRSWRTSAGLATRGRREDEEEAEDAGR